MLFSILLSFLLATLVSGKGSSRILNGNNSTGLPYQVRLARRGCGGSIIKSNWVLTAKHCVVRDFKNDDYTVTLANGRETILAGISNLQDPDGQKREILTNAVSIHNSSDLALLRIDPPFKFNDKVKPIQINDYKEDLKGYDALISGWGQTTNERLPGQLQETVVKIVAHGVGKKAGNVIRLWHPDGQGACYGDSGGPAVIESPEDGKQLLVGVTHGGPKKCGVNASAELNNGPRVSYYVDVFKYADWIYKKIEGCEDRIATNKCERRKAKGKCDKKSVQKRCKMTCGLCG